MIFYLLTNYMYPCSFNDIKEPSPIMRWSRNLIPNSSPTTLTDVLIEYLVQMVMTLLMDDCEMP